MLRQGRSKEEIYKKLLHQGWTIEAIQQGFNTFSPEKKDKDIQKKTIHIIVTIGAILIGVGIFSFIAANWLQITNPIKVSIIVIAMLLSYFAGWYLKEKRDFLKTGEALILLGAIIYGAGIFLVAQMFNVRANWPDGFILWMIGIIALAFAVESFPLFYLAIFLGIVAVINHPWIIFSGFDSNLFLLTSSLLLLVATIVTFITGWLIHQKISPDIKDYY
jgi:uncharacterized membrane protein